MRRGKGAAELSSLKIPEKMDPIPWDFAVAAAWSGMRKAGIAALRLHNFPVWTVLHSLEDLGITELLQLLQAAANEALKIKLRVQVKTNQPLL